MRFRTSNFFFRASRIASKRIFSRLTSIANTALSISRCRSKKISEESVLKRETVYCKGIKLKF